MIVSLAIYSEEFWCFRQGALPNTFSILNEIICTILLDETLEAIALSLEELYSCTIFLVLYMSGRLMPCTQSTVELNIRP
jgi:hypothetical protein